MLAGKKGCLLGGELRTGEECGLPSGQEERRQGSWDAGRADGGMRAGHEGCRQRKAGQSCPPRRGRGRALAGGAPWLGPQPRPALSDSASA